MRGGGEVAPSSWPLAVITSETEEFETWNQLRIGKLQVLGTRDPLVLRVRRGL